MAAISILNSELVQVAAGQKGYRELRGVGAFSTTDATGTIAVGGFNRIDSVTLTPATAPATDETLYCAANSGGTYAISSNAITIGRTGASPTSALKVCFVIKGR